MRWPLVQSLSVDGNDVDLALFKRITYVETLDLSGPRLLLEATDEDRLLRDDFGLVEGAVAVAQLDDSDMAGSLAVTEQFVIKTVDSDANNNLRVECLCQAVDTLKQPADDALFITLEGVEEVLGEATGLGLDVGSFPLVDAWHLLPGERTSKKLRQLAREMGAAVWYSRGLLHMHPLRELWAEPKVHTFHQDDRRKDRQDQIDDFRILYREDLINDRVRRQYAGWNMTDPEGIIGGGGRHEQTQYHRGDYLANLNLATVPAVDLLLFGQGKWEPGQRVELKFHRSREGRPFDESIPPEVMIGAVASQQTKEQYRTRIKGVVLNE